jgi:hypothetical protein
MEAKRTKEPDKVIDAAMIQAVQIAQKITPYRCAFERREAGRGPKQPGALKGRCHG